MNINKKQTGEWVLMFLNCTLQLDSKKRQNWKGLLQFFG